MYNIYRSASDPLDYYRAVCQSAIRSDTVLNIIKNVVWGVTEIAINQTDFQITNMIAVVMSIRFVVCNLSSFYTIIIVLVTVMSSPD